jgi:hypothetical protein
MIYGSAEDGSATFTLSPEEHARFKAGEPVVRITGSRRAKWRITLQAEIKPHDHISDQQADSPGEVRHRD